MKLPPMEEPSTGERWWIGVRTAPICMREISLEAILSYPIPGSGTLHFFHSVPLDGTRDTVKILTRVTARLPELNISEFHQPPEILFPGLPGALRVTHLPYDEKTRSAVFEVLPLLASRYPSQPAGAVGAQFVEALETLVSPELMPYYVALNPDFFAWTAD